MVQVCWSDLPSGAHSLEVDGEPRLTIDGGGPGSAIVDGLAAGAEVRVSIAGTSARPARTLSPPPGRELSRVATISDVHIGERRFGRWPRVKPGAEWRDAPEPYPVMCTKAALREALAWGAQLIVVKGDLTDEDLDEDYEVLGTILAALPVPVIVIPGNHDGGDRSRGDGAGVLASHGVDLTTAVRVRGCARSARDRRELTRDRQAPRQPHAGAARDHRRALDGARRCAARDAPSAVSHGRHDDLAAGHPRSRRVAPPQGCRAREPGAPS